MNDDRRGGTPQQRRPENFRVNIPDDRLNPPREELNSHSGTNAPPPPDMVQAEKRAIRKLEKAHKIRNRRKRFGNRWFFRLIWMVVVLLVGASVAQYAVSGMHDMLGVGKEKIHVTVEIPVGATTEQIAQILKDAGAIKRTDFFRLYSKLTKADGSFNNGTYKIDTGMDYEAIITNLQSNANRVDIVTVTFPEGVNAMEIAQALEKNGVCSQKDALGIMNSSEFNEKYDFLRNIANGSERYYRMEGYLFPDTYDFFKNEDPKQAISKLLANCNKKLTEDLRKQISESGLTLDEVMTLASMIQAEAASEEDMYVISSVFHNRLNSGNKDGLLRLQSDPTMYYPYRSKSLIPAETRDTFESRYNTYNIQGLPPGSICNPGLKAIDAALHPKDTQYYYFCHDADRNPYYAKTLKEHEKNLQKAGLR